MKTTTLKECIRQVLLLESFLKKKVISKKEYRARIKEIRYLCDDTIFWDERLAPFIRQAVQAHGEEVSNFLCIKEQNKAWVVTVNGTRAGMGRRAIPSFLTKEDMLAYAFKEGISPTEFTIVDPNW